MKLKKQPWLTFNLIFLALISLVSLANLIFAQATTGKGNVVLQTIITAFTISLIPTFMVTLPLTYEWTHIFWQTISYWVIALGLSFYLIFTVIRLFFPKKIKKIFPFAVLVIHLPLILILANRFLGRNRIWFLENLQEYLNFLPSLGLVASILAIPYFISKKKASRLTPLWQYLAFSLALSLLLANITLVQGNFKSNGSANQKKPETVKSELVCRKNEDCTYYKIDNCCGVKPVNKKFLKSKPSKPQICAMECPTPQPVCQKGWCELNFN